MGTKGETRHSPRKVARVWLERGRVCPLTQICIKRNPPRRLQLSPLIGGLWAVLRFATERSMSGVVVLSAVAMALSTTSLSPTYRSDGQTGQWKHHLGPRGWTLAEGLEGGGGEGAGGWDCPEAGEPGEAHCASWETGLWPKNGEMREGTVWVGKDGGSRCFPTSDTLGLRPSLAEAAEGRVRPNLTSNFLALYRF